jgi:hypothetical protein
MPLPEIYMHPDLRLLNFRVIVFITRIPGRIVQKYTISLCNFMVFLAVG